MSHVKAVETAIFQYFEKADPTVPESESETWGPSTAQIFREAQKLSDVAALPSFWSYQHVSTQRFKRIAQVDRTINSSLDLLTVLNTLGLYTSICKHRIVIFLLLYYIKTNPRTGGTARRRHHRHFTERGARLDGHFAIFAIDDRRKDNS